MLPLTVLSVVLAGVLCASVRHLEPVSSNDKVRIINGELAGDGEIPHQLSLRPVLLSVVGSHMCGASLIAPNWALTAAHCVPNTPLFPGFPWPYKLVSIGGDVYDVAEVKKHESYNVGDGSFPNDIALIRLTQNVDPSQATPITVANSDSGDFAGQTCVISGWGKLVDDSLPDELYKANVKVLTYGECTSYWDASSIEPQHICVKGYEGDGQGACNGDSGGPLTCGSVLAGATSWGISGCHNGGVVEYPSVYARVSHFYSWIQDTCGCV